MSNSRVTVPAEITTSFIRTSNAILILILIVFDL